jgi:hypothetical protein
MDRHRYHKELEEWERRQVFFSSSASSSSTASSSASSIALNESLPDEVGLFPVEPVRPCSKETLWTAQDEVGNKHHLLAETTLGKSDRRLHSSLLLDARIEAVLEERASEERRTLQRKLIDATEQHDRTNTDFFFSSSQDVGGIFSPTRPVYRQYHGAPIRPTIACVENMHDCYHGPMLRFPTRTSASTSTGDCRTSLLECQNHSCWNGLDTRIARSNEFPIASTKTSLAAKLELLHLRRHQLKTLTDMTCTSLVCPCAACENHNDTPESTRLCLLEDLQHNTDEVESVHTQTGNYNEGD